MRGKRHRTTKKGSAVTTLNCSVCHGHDSTAHSCVEDAQNQTLTVDADLTSWINSLIPTMNKKDIPDSACLDCKAILRRIVSGRRAEQELRHIKHCALKCPKSSTQKSPDENPVPIPESKEDSSSSPPTVKQFNKKHPPETDKKRPPRYRYCVNIPDVKADERPNFNSDGIDQDVSNEDGASEETRKRFPRHHFRQKFCYVCKSRYQHTKTDTRDVEHYFKMCKECADFNYEKRTQRTNLDGHFAVVTGGRIKIGFAFVLKLLRDGCFVITTTRFPHDAAKRYSQETDFEQWCSRLKIYPLDLKDIQAVNKFFDFVKKTVPHLDILVNNAAQTLKRPLHFYRHLLDYETIPHSHIPQQHQSILASDEHLNYDFPTLISPGNSGMRPPTPPITYNKNAECCDDNSLVDNKDKHILSPSTSQPKDVSITHITDCTESQHQSTCPPMKFAFESSCKLDSPSTNDQAYTRPSIEDTAEHSEYQTKTPPSEESQTIADNDVASIVSYPIVTSPETLRDAPSFPDPGTCNTDTVVELTSSATDSKILSQVEPSLKRSASQKHNKYGHKRLKLQMDFSNTTNSLLPSSPFNTPTISKYFPRGAFDEFKQQVDLRGRNSWVTELQNVGLDEMIEVFVINTIAPFLFNKHLKYFLKKSPHSSKFIINVSAMEGQFHRNCKTKYHPHTNMAKAALNMMTRTGALGYKEHGIYMTSVDTGWVTDERPFYQAKHERERKQFVLPLDCIDGAARIYDPIAMGINGDAEPYFAVFLKDYKPHAW